MPCDGILVCQVVQVVYFICPFVAGCWLATLLREAVPWRSLLQVKIWIIVSLNSPNPRLAEAGSLHCECLRGRMEAMLIAWLLWLIDFPRLRVFLLRLPLACPEP